ncbi:MAG TPA: class II aldolase/adducin family protein [Longilinea sp.]|nr:class II aldolase/adducin family protein [Longilinea sp.]
MLCEKLRQEVLKIANLLPTYGLVWMAGGTVCARDVETGYTVVTPSGMPYSGLTPEDMVVTDIHNHVIDGKYRPSVAIDLWTGIFRARLDVNAIVHAHSPYVTAFSVINEPVPIITETMADWFDRPIPVATYLHLEDEGFFTVPIQTLGDGFAVLLGSHGPITVGKSLADALERAVTLEEAAKTYFIAKTIGTPVIFSDAQTRRSYEYYHHRYGQHPIDDDREDDVA